MQGRSAGGVIPSGWKEGIGYGRDCFHGGILRRSGSLHFPAEGLSARALVTTGAADFRDKVTIPFCGGQS
ncbi:MAG: hypothetical protein NC548_25340 [Lachnospiraceae bacterium]|nr:hypothetical protein [Lachnospiraceae bacterium]